MPTRLLVFWFGMVVALVVILLRPV
jgi:hypothetical protein